MIISIDASTFGCSVSLFEGEKLVSSVVSRIDRSSAENLTLMVAEVVRLGGIHYTDLSAVAVAKGPGSYTGLRIAVSSAKGLAMGLDIPLISYESLEVMCRQINFSGGIDLFCPMIDARRMEVFCGFYTPVDFNKFCDIEALIISEDSFKDILETKTVLFLGEGSVKCKSILRHPNALFANEVIYPSADFSGKLVWEKFNRGDFEDLVTFEPFYLKEYMFKTK